MRQIPVLLEFKSVARDSNLSIGLQTRDAAWTIGAGGGDSLGFSFNALALGNPLPSCLHNIELTDSLLSFRTGAAIASDAFDLTVLLRVPDDLESIQGTCGINDEARIYAHLGDANPVEWRTGLISALLPRGNENFRRMRFLLRNAKPGRIQQITLRTEAAQCGEARWSFGPPGGGIAGFSVKAANGDFGELEQLTITAERITFYCGASAATDYLFDAYVERVTPKTADTSTNLDGTLPFDRIHLKADLHPSSTLIARIGMQRPQYVTDTYKSFMF